MASEDQDSLSRFSGVPNFEELLTVQRKERKDLIAKTQKMKHSVPKGDKKKKKEVTAEITQLLADLDLKHEAELKDFNVSQSSIKPEIESQDIENVPSPQDNTEEKSKSSEDLLKEDSNVECQIMVEHHATTNDDANVKSTQRVSKAQKRRNKKAALEEERKKAIAEQELENLSGLRHLEEEAIKKKLSERKLTIFEIPSDGNCLYKAIEHQLSIYNLPKKTVQTLREETSKYMLSHPDDYMPFLTCPETGDAFNEEMYVKYCEDIAKTPAWGGQIEIQVLSNILGFPIEVIQAEGPSIILGDEKCSPKLILSYHRHIYGLGEHYYSVIPDTE